MHDVWDLERSLWLDGVDAYRSRLADGCLMAFGPMGVMSKAAIIESIEQAPRWTAVDMGDTTLTTPGDTIAVVIGYTATATREQSEPYRALCTSTYLILDGELKLAQHQQTPL
jgi:hypothetical protein